jgi:hypothetical protein
MEHDHMVQAFPPNGSNHPLHIGSLPGGARRGQNFADAHVSHLFSEVRAEDGIAVAQQVARQLVEGKGLSQLLPRPLRGRVRGHVAVQNAPSVMGQNQKHIENLETYGRHSEEVDRDQLLGVILQERAPGLRRRLATAHHVFADAGLADVDAQLEQLPVNPGCTPPRILPAHPADQIANLARNDRPSGVAAPHLPGPEPEQGEDLSLVEFKAAEYQGSKQVVASDEIKQQILKTGIRKLERETKVSHHTLKKLLRGESVRRAILAKSVTGLEPGARDPKWEKTIRAQTV